MTGIVTDSRLYDGAETASVLPGLRIPWRDRPGAAAATRSRRSVPRTARSLRTQQVDRDSRLDKRVKEDQVFQRSDGPMRAGEPWRRAPMRTGGAVGTDR
jgi:hypothetical protein